LIIVSKQYATLLAVTLGLGWLVLSTRTIQGVAHTAPFSPWSFGHYVATLLPLLAVALGAILWRLSPAQTRRIGPLLDAATLAPLRYQAVKLIAAALAWTGLAAAAVVEGIVFMLALFGSAVSVLSLLLPALCLLLPTLLLLTGLAMYSFAGHWRLAGGIALLVLALHALPLQDGVDLLGTAYYTAYPLSLGVLDPPFSASLPYIVAKLAYAAIGILLILLAMREKAQMSSQPVVTYPGRRCIVKT